MESVTNRTESDWTTTAAVLRAMLADTLRRARTARRWTQADLTRASGLPLVDVAWLESGDGWPSLDQWARLAGTLGLDPSALLSPEDAASPSPAGTSTRTRLHVHHAVGRALAALRGSGWLLFPTGLSGAVCERWAPVEPDSEHWRVTQSDGAVLAVASPTRPGAHVYVAETHRIDRTTRSGTTIMFVDGSLRQVFHSDPPVLPVAPCWRSGQTMPEWAARTRLHVGTWRPLRASEITEEMAATLIVRSSRGWSGEFGIEYDTALGALQGWWRDWFLRGWSPDAWVWAATVERD